jgi:hypothetical protein
MIRRAASSSTPITTRSGCLKSSIAAPSRRNSGLQATANESGGAHSARMRPISSQAPIGEVDLLTTTRKPSIASPISRAA